MRLAFWREWHEWYSSVAVKVCPCLFAAGGEATFETGIELSSSLQGLFGLVAVSGCLVSGGDILEGIDLSEPEGTREDEVRSTIFGSGSDGGSGE